MARAEAEDGGFSRQIEALGPLADPNAVQTGRIQPRPGTYRCRTIKMGRRVEGQGLAYVEYPWSCSVELTPGGDLVLPWPKQEAKLELLETQPDRRHTRVSLRS